MALATGAESSDGPLRSAQEAPERVVQFKPARRLRIWTVRNVVGNIATERNSIAKKIRKFAKAGILGGIVLSALWGAVAVEGQISPGPLSRAHQSINGLTDCTSCHEISLGEKTYKCLSCHTEIASRIAARRGLHAFYNPQPGSSQKCAGCHSEHNGEDFTIIKFDIRAFDHSQTGYKLEGKHAGVECDRCHLPARISERERATIKVKDLNKTYLGVSADCTNCHQDSHKGRLGQNCLQCHDFTDWKDVAKFDHSLTRYPLTGLHADVACRQCHAPGPDQQPRYRGIAFGDCGNCHTDPHRGSFSGSCQSCHRTSGWKTIATTEMDRVFDHSRTKYPLLGKHAIVDCDSCHAHGDFKKPLAFQKCSDCHRPDPHGGQFDKLAGGSGCSNCHTLDGFKPSTFGLKRHATTAYPLKGKHASLQCGQCHIPKGSATAYKMKFQYCTDCHADAHAVQFAAAPYFNRCEQCHSVDRFEPSTFSLLSHSKSSFPLNGSHEAVPCDSCHKQSLEFSATPTAQYRWTELTCTTCHADPHKGRFNELTRRVEAKGIATGCGVCHSARTWNDLSRFDHFETAFPLTGAHEMVKCTGCHKPAIVRDGLMHVDFKLTRKECEGCHADVHGQQFAIHGTTACMRCHDSKRWKPSLLNHDTQTSFSLQGAHRNVPCDSCHKLTRMVSGEAVLFYKPTPMECVGCHGNRNLKPVAN